MSKQIHEELMGMCDKLDMPIYQRILLTEMVYRKVKCPQEKIDELIDQASKNTVPKQYKRLRKKKYCMQVSVDKERQRLEEELHKCENLPEELFNGDIVENVVRYYYEAICGMD